MSLEFELPDTGEGVTEGTFLEWLVEEGDEVEEDQTVAEVETDKAVVDVPAPSHGTIKELKAEPGDTVDVGEVIMVMETGGESSGEEQDEKTGETGEQETSSEDEDETGTGEEVELEEKLEKETASSDSTSSDVRALPKVRKLAREKGIDISKVEGSGPDGRIIEEDLGGAEDAEVEEIAESENSQETATEETQEQQQVSTPGDVKATPAVRKLAREKGVDLAKVEGSGREGKITRKDMLEAEEGVDTGKAGTVETGQGEVERVKISPSQKVEGEKMAESRFTAPHVTHVEKADITELVALREEKKEEVDAHLTYLPFVMKAAYLAMKKYPDLNAELDQENEEIIRKKYYGFNIAVDTDRGLRTPVIEKVDDKTIVELARDIENEVEKTREGEISREDMEGGTFSITNLGVIGGEEFTPIINPPQVAILGIGKISETAEVVNGEVVPRHTVKLSLSYDHRVIDGATGARFMNKLVENLEDPEHMLIEL